MYIRINFEQKIRDRIKFFPEEAAKRDYRINPRGLNEKPGAKRAWETLKRAGI
jgi:hypothetical protein